ncbi:hypothetical protein C8R43DRAFT_1029908 [Mycena crocata]|nr:hypothetical protein C8R43DRAFT_1029908 [Mycena crocata]
MTVVTVPDGPAVTLAGPGHGKATTFEGHMYTILPVTFIDPASSHFSSITEPSSFRKTATAHGHLTSSHKAASSTHTPSAMTSSHVVKTTITSGKNKATVVSVSGGPAVTLAAKGTTTVIGGSTYTVQPQASSGSSSASANASKASESDSSIAANASTSASTSSTPNAAVTRITGSFYTIVVGSTVTLVGVLFGAFLIL